MAEVLSLRSSGFEAVEQTWREFVPSARLREPAPDGQAELTWQSASLDGLSVVAYRLAGSVRSVAEPHAQLMACRVATDNGWVGAPRRDFDAGLPWATSGAVAQAAWEGEAVVRGFVFDLEHAQNAARRMSGDDALVLDVIDPAARGAAMGAYWERAHAYVLGTLVTESRGSAPHPVIEAELRRHALHATLAAFTTTFTDALDRSSQARPAPLSVRRAISYMETHAPEPITIDDIAEAAGMSTRGLQAAFRRALGTTPTDYLRGVRLAGAHAELIEGGSLPVAEIARRWGFPHASRFAAQYRARYGRTPSDARRHG